MERMPLITSSPQIHSRGNTRSIMGWVILALLPPSGWSIYLFGWRAALLLVTTVAACVITELLLNLASRRKVTVGDLSAVLTGVLIALNMPPFIPLYIPVTASVFAIAVVKWSFGGLGANWMNPALAGRVFVFFSWGRDMSSWTLPRQSSGLDAVTRASIDSVSGPTPLGSVKVALADLPAGVDGPMRLLESAGMPTTYMDLFMGRMGGSLGEMSAMLLIAGGLLLVALRIVNWEIPLAYLGSFALLAWIFDGVPYGTGYFTGDVMFQLLSGGLMLGAWFMATDMATTPLTRMGRAVFGLGCGLFTFIIRHYGNWPEGVSLAIIFMNILTPLIDRWIKPTRYGVSK